MSTSTPLGTQASGLHIEESFALAPLTTFQIGGAARWFVKIRTEDELVGALDWARSERCPVVPLGGGSNLLVSDRGYPGLVIQIGILGVEQQGAKLDVAAGEGWDRLVDLSVERDLAGMECLAGIPGSVGATPIQNVGAYGQEVAQTISSVRAFDRQELGFVEIPAAECRFRYRGSLFNQDQPGRYIVTRVRFQMRPDAAPELRYADLQRAFPQGRAAPSLAEVAAEVRSIRRSKGMMISPGDPDTQGAGSYFKNPVVNSELLPEIAQRAGAEPASVPSYPAEAGKVKLSAAWLVERSGFSKGFALGNAGLSTRHTLALTNRGGATCAEILDLEQHIRGRVGQTFGITLEREPILLGE